MIRSASGKHVHEDAAMGVVTAIRDTFMPDMDEHTGGEILHWLLNVIDEITGGFIMGEKGQMALPWFPDDPNSVTAMKALLGLGYRNHGGTLQVVTARGIVTEVNEGDLVLRFGADMFAVVALDRLVVEAQEDLND